QHSDIVILHIADGDVQFAVAIKVANCDAVGEVAQAVRQSVECGKAAPIGILRRQGVVEQYGNLLISLLGERNVGLAIPVGINDGGLGPWKESLAARLRGLKRAITVAEQNCY